VFALSPARQRSYAVLLAACPAALFIGLAIGHKVTQGVGLTIGIAYLLILLLDVALGIALWVPIVFLAGVPALWAAPDVTTALVIAASIGALRVGTPAATRVLRAHGRLLGILVLMVGWFVASIAWERDPAAGRSQLLALLAAAALMVAIATMAATPRAVRLIVVGFVAGATITVLYGLLDSQVLTPSSSALSRAAQSGRRTDGTGGLFDPNELAAALVPALVLACAMMAVYRGALQRAALASAAVVMAIGLAATESRGGFIGAVVAVVAAIVLFKGRRAALGLGLCVVAAALALWFTANPAAFSRVTNYDGGGSGRTELWRIARAMAAEHPLTGVGYGGFRTEAPLYERRVGPLKSVAVTIEHPKVVHNTYLQVLAEDGIVGLALFLGVVLGGLLAADRAARLLDRRGSPALAGLARAVLVGTIGLLAAAFFVSLTTDYRLWLMLALGPALLGVARGPLVADAFAGARVGAPRRP
jgi:O-antigen ligase